MVKGENKREQIETEELTVPAAGMTCAACVRTVEEALRGLPGGRLFAVGLTSSKGLAGMIMRLVGHRFEEGYMDRLKSMALEAGFGDVETAPVDSALAYVRGTKAS